MPATVELSFLEEVKQLELYGTELYPLLVGAPVFKVNPLNY